MGDERILREMGERIWQRRKALGMTQEQVAEKMNVSVQMISNLELGKKAIRPENLIKICSVLSVSSDYILTGEHKDKYFHQEIIEKIHRLPPKYFALVRDIIDVCLNSKE